ncbi:hypothetical protein ElyMa_001420700 [Elysia marginata]|uniref:Uncharacterized protein n=1 Tax=Elysia marginata TaxID=1093978 RepID=A0AAV4IYS0_9GAST|nr:hypothetical protein ElyMa_001420700 [Elysia marginata]
MSGFSQTLLVFVEDGAELSLLAAGHGGVESVSKNVRICAACFKEQDWGNFTPNLGSENLCHVWVIKFLYIAFDYRVALFLLFHEVRQKEIVTSSRSLLMSAPGWQY